MAERKRTFPQVTEHSDHSPRIHFPSVHLWTLHWRSFLGLTTFMRQRNCATLASLWESKQATARIWAPRPQSLEHFCQGPTFHRY